MCGITGFIGESKHPDVSYELLTSLFALSEIRGTDAAGFWGTQKDGGKILYHKQPDKSSEFVKTQIWKAIRHMNPNLILCHARGASMGVGAPSINHNNHPFVTSDKCIGLVHNGRIPEPEYDVLSKKYETVSRCDSEILLRIFEAGERFDESLKINDENEEKQIDFRLAGLTDIWSQVIKGHMAVGIGERLEEGYRRLWLMRNDYRPIWIIDLRKHLGQVFFCSTPEIWREAVKKTPAIQKVMRGNRKVKLIELPPEEIWVLTISPESPVVRDELLRKFEVRSEGMFSYAYSGEPIKFAKRQPTVEVFTKLDAEEDVVDDNKKKVSYSYSYGSHTTAQGKYIQGSKVTTSYSQGYNNYNRTNYQSTKSSTDAAVTRDDEAKELASLSIIKLPSAKIKLEDIMEECTNIKKLVEEIETLTANKSLEGSLKEAELQALAEDLDRIKLDLEGTVRILES